MTNHLPFSVKNTVLCLLSLVGSLLPEATAYAESKNEYARQIEIAVTETLEPQAARLATQLNASRYEVTVKPVSTKLSLPLCSGKVEVKNLSRRQTGSQKLKVSCETPRNWKVYVQATIEVHANVLVSSTTLEAGKPVTVQNVMFQEMDISSLKRGFFTDLSELQAKTARRTIRPNTQLTPALLQETPVIQKGDRINIISGVNSIHVQMPGEALEDGTAGEQIRVKNIAGGKIIYGRVRDASSVITGN